MSSRFFLALCLLCDKAPAVWKTARPALTASFHPTDQNKKYVAKVDGTIKDKEKEGGVEGGKIRALIEVKREKREQRMKQPALYKQEALEIVEWLEQRDH